MGVRVKKFQIGKDASLKDLNRFLQEQAVRSADVLHVSISELGRDTVEYILTYEDSQAPRIILTFPEDGQRGVAPGTTVLATFSEPIQALSSADIEIFNVTDNVVVPTSSYTIDNTDVGLRRGIVRIIDTGGYLVDQKTYRITYQTTIRDLAGNPMEEPYDLIFTASTALADLDFDGGRVLSFSNPSLNRWEAVVTPTRLTFSDLTDIQLTLRGGSGEDVDGFNLHYEPVGASFRVVIEHGNHLSLPEPTGILPTGVNVDWLAINNLL